MASTLPFGIGVVVSGCNYCAVNVPARRAAAALLTKQLLNPQVPVVSLPAAVTRPGRYSVQQPAYLNILSYLSKAAP